MTDLTLLPWSADGNGGIYSGPGATGKRIGTMETPGLAETVVAEHNAGCLRRKVLATAGGAIS